MKSLYLAAAAAALLATPVVAQERAGSVRTSYNGSTLGIADTETDADVVSIDGAVALPISGDWTVTLEGVVDRSETDAGDNLVGGAGVHVSRLLRPDVRFGGFVMTEGLNDGAQGVGGGVEIQKYFGGATVTGRGSYANYDDLDANIWTLGAEAAFYVGPSLRLHAAASFNKAELTEIKSDAWTYGVGAEYQITNTAFSLTADYSRAEWEVIETDTFSIGLRYSFGGDFQTRDRSGAGLNFRSIMRPINFFAVESDGGGDDGDDGGDPGPL